MPVGIYVIALAAAGPSGGMPCRAQFTGVIIRQHDRLGAAHHPFAPDIAKSIDQIVPVMLKFTDYVMRFAPLGVFAAMSAVITTQGLGVLVTYGKFVSAFYFGLVVLWTIIIGAGSVVLGGAIRPLLRLLRQPMMIAFSTSCSEAAFPKMIEQLMKFGVSERITGFVLPLGYSFNLDGSMTYQTFAALFVAQASASRCRSRPRSRCSSS